jgi:hypothetical protein
MAGEQLHALPNGLNGAFSGVGTFGGEEIVKAGYVAKG